MANTFRPMKAFDAPLDWYQKTSPVWMMSRKYDGFRAVVHHGQLLSNTLKLIRNRHTQHLFGRYDLEGLDGELIVGSPAGEGVFSRTCSGVTAFDGVPDVRFYIFDLHHSSSPFQARHVEVFSRVQNSEIKNYLTFVEQVPITSAQHIADLEAQFLREGYEGAMLKNRYGHYKWGRSTLREGGMGKLKRFRDSEAIILDFEELMHNDNEATVDNFGLSKRSSHVGNKRAANTLGALVVRDINQEPWVFNIGTGFDAALKQEIWDNRDKYKGRIVKYKYLPIGTLDLPRHPVFLGFRSPEDL